MEVIRISVRNLVEFILREGDIDNRKGAGSKEEAMQEGTRLHRKIQKGMGSSYRAEVPLVFDIPCEQYALRLEGRADGIYENQDGMHVDEIKCIYRSVEDLKQPVPVHLAQAKCYAYMYAAMEGLTEIGVQMTYCNIETEHIKRFHEVHSFAELEKWFCNLITQYQKWADHEYNHRMERNASIEPLQFPFSYREGQRDMTASIYSSIKREENLFVQAPTGIGKTMATIFPSIKAIGQGMGEKLFYLTAKTSLHTVALATFDTLRKNGLHYQTIAITAKEKCCPMETVDCNPENCPYAKGHYDRVNDAIFDLITHEQIITHEVIMDYANKYEVCPFEFELDVSLFVDGIVCDYNYAFDPRVNLKRYFAEGIHGDYLFLVDEAHNLVDRARTMYSAELYKEDFLSVKGILDRCFHERFAGQEQKEEFQKQSHLDHDEMKELESFQRKLIGRLEKCNKELLDLKRECENYVVLESINAFYLKALLLMSAFEDYLSVEKQMPEKDKVLNLYFALRHFMDMYEKMDEKTVIYTEQVTDRSFLLKLYCVDPSTHLQNRLQKARSTVFFSATMLPIHYYKELLSNQQSDRAIYIASPFKQENRKLLLCKDVSSRYQRRGTAEYRKICSYIETVCQTKEGNYMVFFPSYQMLGDVYDVATSMGLNERFHVISQTSNMKEEERLAFLDAFQRESAVIGFCILGGIFSEGIDLIEDRLIGTFVVGTGLPMVCNEREILMQYFDMAKGNGFDYAYRYPGMNKVEQAAGRVIRTEEDKGTILLMDDRFLRAENISLFPAEWADYEVTSLSQIATQVEDFWYGK